MLYFLKLYLIVTGVGAALVMLFPTLVVVGLILFIVPGLILSLMPAAFMWGVAFAILWLPLQYFTGPWIASAITIPAVVIFFWFVATPGHKQGLARLAAVDLPDVLPQTHPIALRGHVRIDVQLAKLNRSGSGRNVESRIRCDGLCTAVLFTPGVESVTLSSWRPTDKPDDYVFGGDVGARYGRWLARANLQYALRTRGDFDYRYGNDVQWTIGAGHYLLLTEGQTVALNVNFSGEYKYFDTFQGGHPEDTQSRILFLGPQISSSFQDRYSVDFRADFPVQEYGSAIQTLPAYRLRLSFLMRF